MAAVDLAIPSIADFNLTVSRRRAVSDYEMVRQSIWHFANVTMVVVKDSCVALARPAVMNDDIFPAIAGDTRIIDGLSNRRGQVLPANTASAMACTSPFGKGGLRGIFIIRKKLNR